MKNHAAPSPKKSSLLNVVIVVVMLSIVGLAIWSLPRGYSTDLLQIGKGKNIVVQVHDHSSVSSVHLMESLHQVRTEYTGLIEFVVADLNTAEGQAFAKTQNVNSTTLIFFAPNGTRIGIVQGAQEVGILRSTLSQVFNLPSPKN